MFKIAKHKSKALCPAYRCCNKPGTKKRFCPRHHHMRQAETNPLGYTYSLLKTNAKRRGKVFTLTLEQFRQFCTETNYLALKGKQGSNLSIDRIDNSKGYEAGNLQVLTLSANSRKGCGYCPF